jgi:hypothetical protein
MNREQLAWAAGFFDGDGWVTSSRGASRRRKLQLGVAQSGDPEVLFRFRDAVGVPGNVTGPYARPPHKAVYRYTLQRFEYGQAVLAMLWPWLSEVKRRQAKTALAAHGKVQ